MPVPRELMEAAAEKVAAYCNQRSTDDYRIEHATRGASITIVERRPPWNPDYGSEWSSTKIAQLRYDERARCWKLYAAGSTTAGTPTSSHRRQRMSRGCSTRSSRTAPASSGAEQQARA